MSAGSVDGVASEITDPVNARILAVSEDRIDGFVTGPFAKIVLGHKLLIDQHLREVGIPVPYTNVFWGGRSEIKPSEISPVEYAAWCERVGFDRQETRNQRVTSNK